MMVFQASARFLCRDVLRADPEDVPRDLSRGFDHGATPANGRPDGPFGDEGGWPRRVAGGGVAMIDLDGEACR